MDNAQIFPRLLAATTAAALFASPAAALAQELEPAAPDAAARAAPGGPGLDSAGNTNGDGDGNGDQGDEVDKESEKPDIRTEAPNTDQCPHREHPAEPVTTSERLAPGQTSPQAPPPVDDADCGVTAPPGFTVDKDVVASAWVISDIDTGEVIAEKDPNGRYRPASIIKVLLALEVIDKLDLDKKVTASEEAADADGSAVGIGAGGEYTVEDLLHGLLMASGNDAAHALADELGGEQKTLALVNERARALGAKSTYVASYSGLDAPGMQTTAHDLSLMYQAAFQNPTFAKIVRTKTAEFPGYDDHPAYEMGNDNGLLLNDADGIGGKTGYTDDAHHTFAGAMDRNGRRLQVILLDTTIEHGPHAWEQAQKLLQSAYDVAPGKGVGSLQPAGDESSNPSTLPSPAPGADGSGGSGDSSQSGDLGRYGPWIGGVAVGVIALAAIAAAALLPRRSRGRHANR